MIVVLSSRCYLLSEPAVSMEAEDSEQNLDNENFEQRFCKRYDGFGSYLLRNRVNKRSQKVKLDCEGFTHYLQTGALGKFEEAGTPNIREVGFEATHEPYACYKIWSPRPRWDRAENGLWRFQHYFVALSYGECVSNSGSGPIRIFDSFKEMLVKDAFPRDAFVDANGDLTKDVDQAVIGESLVYCKSDYKWGPELP